MRKKKGNKQKRRAFINNLKFPDDVTIISKDLKELHEMIQELNRKNKEASL